MQLEAQNIVYWTGSVFDPSALMGRPALVPSQNEWSLGLINGMRGHGADVRIIAHMPERLWPRGQLFPVARDNELLPYAHGKVRYCNAGALRTPTLTAQYPKVLTRCMAEPEATACVLSYNPYPWHKAVGQAARRAGVPWICIVLDYDDVGPEWSNLRRDLVDAAGVVFLSRWGFDGYPGPQPKLHLDGGISGWKGDAPRRTNGKRIVMYAGKYAGYGGVQVLIDAICQTPGEDVEFWMAGRIFEEKVREQFRRDRRIRYLGFLEKDELENRMAEADVFVNPRPPEMQENRMIFPSKILHYLSFGRPVVSTWTDGLAPEYRDLMFFPTGDGSAALADAIRRALDIPLQEREALRDRIRAFVCESRQWSLQAGRLLQWIQHEIIAQ
ncbi:MAG TPA: glycosyltransferase [Rhizobium sp.]|nr:glycosyltransferase [Rhizobium sp.]